MSPRMAGWWHGECQVPGLSPSLLRQVQDQAGLQTVTWLSGDVLVVQAPSERLVEKLITKIVDAGHMAGIVNPLDTTEPTITQLPAGPLPPPPPTDAYPANPPPPPPPPPSPSQQRSHPSEGGVSPPQPPPPPPPAPPPSSSHNPHPADGGVSSIQPNPPPWTSTEWHFLQAFCQGTWSTGVGPEINKKFRHDVDWTCGDGRTVLLTWITKGNCRAVFGINHRWVLKYSYWQGGQSNQIECEMYNRVPHLLPPTFRLDAAYSCVLQGRAEFTLETLLGGPTTTEFMLPLLGKLCEYLRTLTLEACRHRLRIKDFSPRNVAYFAADWGPPGGGLSPHGPPGGGMSPHGPPGGGMSPHGWACCDFGNWELMSALSEREVWHHLNEIFNRLKSSDHWERRSNALECMRSWLVSRPGEHRAEQATDYLMSTMNFR